MQDQQMPILVLCDDEDVRQRITSMAERCGCSAPVVLDTVDALGVGSEALGVLVAYFRRIEPLHTRFVQKLSRRCPNLKTIVVSDDDAAAPAVDVMRAGADYYVATAALEDRLFDAIEDMVELVEAIKSAGEQPGGSKAQQGGEAARLNGLRDTLYSLMALSRDAMSALRQARFEPDEPLQSQGASWFELGMSMRDLERRAISEALRECGNNRTRAAGLLQISIRTLHRKIREYGLP